MGYNRGDSLTFDYEPNGNPFGSKSEGKLLPRSYSIQCERKWKYSFLSEREEYDEMYETPSMRKITELSLFIKRFTVIFC